MGSNTFKIQGTMEVAVEVIGMDPTETTILCIKRAIIPITIIGTSTHILILT
jgi:UDP-N-acetylenolpyruvoylglucosamine reductase